MSINCSLNFYLDVSRVQRIQPGRVYMEREVRRERAIKTRI